MFLVFELLLVLLLTMILFMLYRIDLTGVKDRPPYAVLKEYWKGKERREHVRFNKALEVEYIVEKKTHLRSNGKTVDISQGGMRLLVDEKFAKGVILDLKMKLPKTNRVVEVEGEVVWSEDAETDDPSGKRFFYAGVKFLGIKEPAGKHLAEYLKSIGIAG